MVFRILNRLDGPISFKFGTNIEAINIFIENWSFALAQYVQHINELWNPMKKVELYVVEFLYSYMLKGVANTSQNGKFVSLLPLLCKLTKCHFYDISLLCIRIENS